MVIVDDTFEQIGAMLHPGKTVRKRTVAGTLKYYYGVMALPLVISLALVFTLGKGSLPGMFNTSLDIVAVGVALFYLVVIPLWTLLGALVAHVIGANFLQAFKGRYSDTLSGVTYGQLAFAPLIWLVALSMRIPLLGMLLIMVLGGWAFVVEVIGVAKLNKASRASAFAVAISSGALVWIAVYVVMMIVLSSGFYNPYYFG
jgi:hypothetical protein